MSSSSKQHTSSSSLSLSSMDMDRKSPKRSASSLETDTDRASPKRGRVEAQSMCKHLNGNCDRCDSCGKCFPMEAAAVNHYGICTVCTKVAVRVVEMSGPGQARMLVPMSFFEDLPLDEDAPAELSVSRAGDGAAECPFGRGSADDFVNFVSSHADMIVA